MNLPEPTDDQQWDAQAPHYRRLLTMELELLRQAQGWPTLVDIARQAEQTGRPVSTQAAGTVFILREDRAPGWPTVRRVVEVLGGDLRYFYPLHLRALGTPLSRRRFGQYEGVVAPGLATLNTNPVPFTDDAGDVLPEPVGLQFIDVLPDRSLSRRERLPHEQWAAQLKAQPGRWARVPGVNPGYCTAVLKATVHAYRPAGAFEAAMRDNEIYVRYVGR